VRLMNTPCLYQAWHWLPVKTIRAGIRDYWRAIRSGRT
jgi:hypothetical protein